MRLYDGTYAADIKMCEFNKLSNSHGPDFSKDFFEAGHLDYSEMLDAYKVKDTKYCIEQALEWGSESEHNHVWYKLLSMGRCSVINKKPIEVYSVVDPSINKLDKIAILMEAGLTKSEAGNAIFRNTVLIVKDDTEELLNFYDCKSDELDEYLQNAYSHVCYKGYWYYIERFF